MARQRMSKKNVKKYSEKYNMDIVEIFVRGGTDHRKDLCLRDKSVIHLFKDGAMVKGQIGWRH